jgi:kynureninase
MTAPSQTFHPGLEYARQLDTLDELAAFRAEFVIDDPDLIYLDGNSLGRLPKASLACLQTAAREQWGERLIRGWGEGWYDAPRRLGDQLAVLLGAAPGQIVVGDSTTVNFFKLVMAALEFQGQRSTIVSDELNFPTDLYTLQNCIRLLGGRHSLKVLTSPDGIHADEQAIFDSMDASTALITFSTPTFKSGFLYDVPAITAAAHRAGALVLWDFSHGGGSIPIELDAWGVDFAVGCTYKYLNGGPGSPAWLYVRKDLQQKVLSPIGGWWAHRSPFTFDLDFTPAEGISRFLAGTPSVLSLLMVEPALEIALRAGMPAIRQKSVVLTNYMTDLVDHTLAPLGFSLGSPRDPQRRGSHISIRHADAYRINLALIHEMKVIPDFREPNNLRLGLTPLYTTFEEVWEAVQRIVAVVTEKRHEKYSQQRSSVT